MALMTSGLAEGGSGADTFVLSGSLKGASLYGGSAGSSDGNDLMSVAGGISAGAVYGNKGDDSLVVLLERLLRRHPSLVVGGNDSTTINGAVTSLSYEGGLDADSLFVSGALTSSTVYGDNSGANYWWC